MSHKATYWLATIDPRTISAGAFRVLFHLCDHHNDERDPESACFPSQETLREKTGLSNGGLNKCLDTLSEAGLLSRKRSTIPGSRERRTYYILGCDRIENTGQTPLNGVSTNSTGVEADTEQTPLLGLSNYTFEHNKLHPSGEEPVREPKKEPVSKKDARETVSSILGQWASREAVSSFMAYRRKTKGRSLTETAAKRQAKQLQIIFNAGHDPSDALGMAEEHGWIAVKAEWYLNRKEVSNGNQPYPIRAIPGQPGHRADAALEQISRLAGIGQAPGDGGV